MESVTVMNDRRINVEDRRSHVDRRRGEQGKGSIEAVAGGAFTESAGGIGAIILTILGLAGIAPVMMISISAIVIGAVLIIKGAAVSAEYSKIARGISRSNVDSSELGGGLSGEVLAGIAAVVLGILSLLAINQLVLLPIAAIVLGSGLVLGSGVNIKLNNLRASQQENRTYQKVVSDMVSASVGAQVLIGLGSIVLGILALLGIAPVLLTLVALLSLGVAVLFTGTSVGGKMMNMVFGTS